MSGCFNRATPLYDEVPPNDVPDLIDWVSEAWLVSEVNVVDGGSFGIVALVGNEGERGKGFSEGISCVGNDGT
jgi:hypothetical protein